MGPESSCASRAQPNPPPAPLRLGRSELAARQSSVQLQRSAFDESPNIGTSYDAWKRTRTTIHMLVRLAFQEGEDWLVEILEHARKMNSAQTAFAVAHVNRRHEERREERKRTGKEA